VSTAERTGYVDVPGGRVWYKVVGVKEEGIPLLTLHGGPGMPHDYLQPLEALSHERQVIFYDQLGCGRSDLPDDPNLWRIERFVTELKNVRQALDLDRFHLLGHSWGTMLAVDYVLTNPEGMVSLILASPCLSVSRWMQDVGAFRKQLPQAVQSVLEEHEASGSIDSPEYEEATMVFYKRHFCRLEPWPDPMKRTWDRIGLSVYNTMWGPAEFLQTGNLENFDRTDRLREIRAPVLITCGRYDESPPETNRWYQGLFPDAELVVFERSSHTPHLEESERYIATVREFLRSVEPRKRLIIDTAT